MKNFIHSGIAGLVAVGLAACVADTSWDQGTEEEGLTDSVSQAEVTACPGFAAQIPNVKYDKELVITNPAVVDDPCRTIMDNPLCTDPNKTQINGKWSFWYLMSQMAGSNNVSRFVLKWLESFEADDIVVNGQTLQARTPIRSLIIDPWRQKSGCAIGLKYDQFGGACNLNPKLAPFRLLGIFNRVDLRSGGAGSVDPYGNIVSGGDAGEGRFVFGFTQVPNSVDSVANATQLPDATMIFEYKLPTNNRTAQQWALAWRALGNFTTFDAGYKNALQTITEGFVKNGLVAGNPNNGSSIAQVRSDEKTFHPPPAIASQKVWSMREFKLGCLPGQTCGTNDRFLVNTTTGQTPPHDSVWDPINVTNQTTTLDAFLTENQTSIINGTHVVPAMYNGVHFLAGDSRSRSGINAIQWNRTNDMSYMDPNVCTARRLFAFSTCSGCHYFETDNTVSNLHIRNRDTGVPSELSPFLSQSPRVVTSDPCEVSVSYDEPKRRKCELLALAAGKSTPVNKHTGRTH
ncbi:hypothetical protein [Polyangium spumosum]|uniref:Lipoprotein n=1 Tax=Polyangium spumosum TaxID=889282 RepID=A0A6N7PJP5_9BACT|nr:hypothetical protein [Polyangium spumosum]MRG92362.1 hypothetical protein [Polyangium spumosum]